MVIRKESPYFRPTRRRVVGGSPHSESPYFVTSASSSWGSAKSLGSLLFCCSDVTTTTTTTTTNHNDDCNFEMGGTSDTVSCNLCTTAVAYAVRHFNCCPVFRDRWNRSGTLPPTSNASTRNGTLPPTSNASTRNDTTSTRGSATHGTRKSALLCCELAEERLHEAIRHLCPCRCFMRAYAPYRDWFNLRKQLMQHRTDPIDQLLSGWRCLLLLPASAIGKGSKGTTSMSGARGRISFLPRTMFVNSFGEVFSNVPAALKHLRAGQLGILKRSLQHSSVPKFRLPPRRIEPAGNLCPRAIFAFDGAIRPYEIGAARASSSQTLDYQREIRTPYGLLEELFADDPWRLLLSTIFLNRTCRVQVDAILYSFLQEWPTASAVTSETNHGKLSLLLQPTGMRHRRAAGIVRFSHDYLALLATTANICGGGDDDDGTARQSGCAWTRKDILSLYYCGEYAYAAYQLFIERKWNIDHADHALKAFAEFQRGQEADRYTR